MELVSRDPEIEEVTDNYFRYSGDFGFQWSRKKAVNIQKKIIQAQKA